MWPTPERHPTAARLKRAGAPCGRRFTPRAGGRTTPLRSPAHADRLLRPTDLLPLRADVLTDLASALAARGDIAKATQVAGHALALHTEKGNIVAARRARNTWAALNART
jgi:hypothetical protein